MSVLCLLFKDFESGDCAKITASEFFLKAEFKNKIPLSHKNDNYKLGLSKD